MPSFSANFAAGAWIIGTTSANTISEAMLLIKCLIGAATTA
jgi:hypothetical protein